MDHDDNARFQPLTREEERRLQQAAKALKDVERLLTEPAMMALPHPVRIAAVPGAGAPNLVMTASDPRHQKKLASLLREGLSTNGIFQTLSDLNDARLFGFLGLGMQAGSFGNGPAGGMFQSARYELAGGRLYSFSDELVDILADTDLGDVPLEELKLPHKNVYLQLGLNRLQSRFRLVNPESGLHALEGAYVSETTGLDGRPRLEVTFTGSPVGHTELLDDTVEWVSVLVEPNITAKEAALKSFLISEAGVEFPGEAELRARAEYLGPILELVSKAILFIGMPQARIGSSNAGTVARQALARAVSGAHRRKAQKAAALAYDCILVDAPAPTPEEALQIERHGAIAAHWRQAHFRHQRHGPQLSLSKVIWIPRTLINADQIGRAGS